MGEILRSTSDPTCAVLTDRYRYKEVRTMVAGCGPKVAKLLLLTFNVAVTAVGCVLISIASWITHFAKLYQDLFIDDNLLVVTSLLIAVGTFLFIFSFIGCLGALKEGPFILKLYFVLLVAAIIIQIAAGIVAFTFVSRVQNSMLEGMTYAINITYGTYASATFAVNTVQTEFNCCGATGPSDYTGCKGLPEGYSVPESCCKTEGNDCHTGDDAKPGYPDPTKKHLVNYDVNILSS
ncbi:hypothetical protein BSL78_05402 [Apostichopus japonicus]|uniref:Uncharacterized protein n=1 Tax=Stichopus japonicus TaxID=307972 RepID=A0A2G8LBY1_STIJA|nr:hypothetical protein BSL78_05402 [Apostichopus japonicus]